MPAAKTYLCDGKMFPSIRKLAAAYKRHEVGVARRLREGSSPEEAVGIKKRQRKGHGQHTIINGVAYPTRKAACDALGLNSTIIQARVDRGYSVEDAIAGNIKQRALSALATPMAYLGIKYPSKTALAAAFGQTSSNVTRRLARGWSLGQALLDEPAPPRFRNHEGHARSAKWKQTQVGEEGEIEPIPDEGGFKLYLIRHIQSGKEYIGITTGMLQDRLSQHFSSANQGRKSKLANAMRKYGAGAFSIELIRADATSLIKLQKQEINEISKRNTIKAGFNVSLGGSLGTPKALVVGGRLFHSRKGQLQKLLDHLRVIKGAQTRVNRPGFVGGLLV